MQARVGRFPPYPTFTTNGFKEENGSVLAFAPQDQGTFYGRMPFQLTLLTGRWSVFNVTPSQLKLTNFLGTLIE